MPKTAYGWTIQTLQDKLEGGYRLTIHCACGHSLSLSLPKLIEVFGADFVVSENRDYFLSRFVCNACGRRAIGVTMSPSGTPVR
ncbi:hypothetical protein [Pelagibacterium limicola]|uniref:hypothetical protein n=1 Tax=Pelagibacterium limicola TaxID=2791022 RepID=UPI0018AF80C7|nr:hypothetical protein [Pelagibacterium limicola]